MSAAEGDIDDLEDAVNDLSGNGRLWYIGDSFLDLTPNWGSYLDTFMGRSDSYVTNEGGIGFVNQGNITHLNLAQLVESKTDVPTDIDTAIVIAGCNDCKAANQSGLNDAVHALIAQIKAKVPNIRRILFGFNGTYQGTGYSDYANRIGYVGTVHHSMVNYILDKTKCGFMESVGWQLQTSIVLNTDGVHPTSTGSMLIAKAVKNHLIGAGDVVIDFRREVGPLTQDICHNGYVTMDTKHSATVTVSGNITAGVYFSLGTFELAYYPRFNFQCVIPFHYAYVSTSGGHEILTAGHLLVRPSGEISLYSPNVSVSSVTGISFEPSGGITVPVFTPVN